MRVGLKLAFLVGLSWVIAGNAAMAGVEALFQPHRALYAIKLKRAASGADIVDVKGKMAFEWRGDCDGWTVEQRYLMRYFTSAGSVSDISTSYATWESGDGQNYRFRIKKNRDGAIEELKGAAHLGKTKGAAGTVTYSSPVGTQLDLTPKALFPTGHTLALIDHAQRGERFFAARLFDGGEIESDVAVTAAIGRPVTPDAGEHKELNGDYWPVRLAFFSVKSDSSEPEYEMEISLHANGVVRSLVLDYGDFAAQLSLEHFEALEGGVRAGC